MQIRDENLVLWQRIVDELADLQDQSPGIGHGQVLNAISRRPFIHDTACAAKVFAAEYRRTGDKIWCDRAEAALANLAAQSIHTGVDEMSFCYHPGTEKIRERSGYRDLEWGYVGGSLYATGTSVDAIWKAMELLGKQPCHEDMTTLLNYIQGCLLEPGSFAHDTLRPDTKPPGTQNITAIALYLMEEIVARHPGCDHAVLRERASAVRNLVKFQEPDGLWPYLMIPLATKGNFADSMHHCLLLHYFASSFLVSGAKAPQLTLTRGWEWIREHLRKVDGNIFQFDFNWESKLSHISICNHYDNNTYFLILALLPSMIQHNVLSAEEGQYYGDALLRYIERHMLEPAGTRPCVNPHPKEHLEMVQYIVPMVEESVGWKGSLLADWFLGQNS